MRSESRERRLAAAFVSLADTLVDDYDVVALLQQLVDTSAELLDASAGGLLLADELGELAVVASTSERTRLVELMQLNSGFGPCVEAFRTGSVVEIADIEKEKSRWPAFQEAALGEGFLSVLAVPLRLRSETIGTLNLFRAETGLMAPEDVTIAQGLADVATIGILPERALRESDTAREQLQNALNSRVIIEQAKGVIAQSRSVDMDEAFRVLRTYSRGNNVALRDVADLVVRRSLKL
ncbi:GAF and ANTAR domain-containing protein [soil metagenome]